ncbi:flagellar basal body L-ring protein FlgH [Aeromonas sp. RU39B]|uniref:flagellar basal body L-ring protein FlgH n=1 Tax=Aeromonas sp. RU39B TaxID=1907416 RepID=UPI0011782634
MKPMRRLILALLPLWLAACSTYEVLPPKDDDEAWKPSVPKQVADRGEDGSLYRGDYMFALFQDRRAYRVGDILTVTLAESTQSSKKAATALGKSSSVNVDAPTFGTKTRSNLAATFGLDSDFDGSATASQQNSLSGYITVTVSEVLNNGVLQIKGQKWIRLNQGDEYLRLSGTVRVEDIDQANRISSQRIADAHITYAGRGALADSNQTGWLTRFFNSAISPF